LPFTNMHDFPGRSTLEFNQPQNDAQTLDAEQEESGDVGQYHCRPRLLGRMPLQKNEDDAFDHNRISGKQKQSKWTVARNQRAHPQHQTQKRDEIHRRRVKERLPERAPFELPQYEGLEGDDYWKLKNVEAKHKKYIDISTGMRE